LQSSSDLGHFHARPLPYSHLKSRDDLISGLPGDSGVLYPFIYIDERAACEVAQLFSDLTLQYPAVVSGAGQPAQGEGGDAVQSLTSAAVDQKRMRCDA